MVETRLRSLVKGFSWRALGTLDTTLIAWFVTGNVLKALSIGSIEVFTKVLLYYGHERAWLKVKWGLSNSETTKIESNPTPQTFSANTNTSNLLDAQNNIHPTFDKLISREEKEGFLKQKGKVLWLTGLSGSGKSTIAQMLEKELLNNGYFTKVLDGDNIRTGINNNLGFSIEDRQENIRRIAEVAKLFKETGVITICSFISPTNQIRQFAKEIIGGNDFIEIFINTPLAICEERDVKGLYKKARKGEIKNFTGIDSPFENPKNPYIEVNTVGKSVEDSTNQILLAVLQQIRLN